MLSCAVVANDLFFFYLARYVIQCKQFTLLSKQKFNLLQGGLAINNTIFCQKLQIKSWRIYVSHQHFINRSSGIIHIVDKKLTTSTGY